jgi:hypothetical protein
MISSHLSASLKVEYLHTRYSPTPYLSSLTKVVSRAADKTMGGAVYNLGSSFGPWVGRCGRFLIAVKKLFRRKAGRSGPMGAGPRSRRP